MGSRNYHASTMAHIIKVLKELKPEKPNPSYYNALEGAEVVRQFLLKEEEAINFLLDDVLDS